MSKQPHKETGNVSVFVRERAASSVKGETVSVNQALEQSGQVHAATECSKCVSFRESLTWGSLHQISLFFSFFLGEGRFLVARERAYRLEAATFLKSKWPR